ncbi:MAG: acetate--CoA ligase family protein [Alphaproteobacteria bacterium]|nr:acetate--CoA ligase family protein [Alphaproteobacteria bacterium]
MTTHNLQALFEPASVALVGASQREGSVGAILTRNLLRGGFKGTIHLINPHAREIEGRPCLPSVDALPEPIDLAVVATPAAGLPQLIDQLASRGCRCAIVISAGLGADQADAIVSSVRPSGLRILGPNCLGMLSPGIGLNLSFSHCSPEPGSIAFLTQSGAIATSMIDWSRSRNIGFSRIVSLGDMRDIDFGDLLDYLDRDQATSSILIYAETITSARKFVAAGRRTGRGKPIFILKAGRSHAGALAAASHTGAMAGADAVHDAAFPRAGMVRIDTLRDLYGIALALSASMTSVSPSLSIVTNGGGLGVLAADAAGAAGVRLPPPSTLAISKLDQVMPRSWSRANPIDILGDAHADRYDVAVRTISGDAADSSLLIMNCPTGVADRTNASESVAALRQDHKDETWLSCWAGEESVGPSSRHLRTAGIANFDTPEEAVRAIELIASRSRVLALSSHTPPPALVQDPSRSANASAIVKSAIADGRTLLTEAEAKAILELFGVPVSSVIIAPTPEAAAELAEQIGFPVVLKILSKDITHKSDVGGVRLGLSSGDETKKAAEEMLSTLARNAPTARLEGFTLQSMIRKPLGHEAIIGAVRDPVFGPCLLVGQGGVSTEIVHDRALGLAPVDRAIGLEMISRTRISRLLAGFRHVPPARVDAIADALCALSDLMISCADITEIDVNPLLVDADGAIGLDARIRLRDPNDIRSAQTAIVPWPAEIGQTLTEPGDTVIVRASRPADQDRFMSFDGERIFESALPGSFSPPRGAISEALVHDDYYREATFVAVGSGDRLLGVGRVQISPERDRALHDLTTIHACAQTVRCALIDACLQFATLHGLSHLVTFVNKDGPGRILADSLGSRYQQTGVSEGRLTGLISLQSAT